MGRPSESGKARFGGFLWFQEILNDRKEWTRRRTNAERINRALGWLIIGTGLVSLLLMWDFLSALAANVGPLYGYALLGVSTVVAYLFGRAAWNLGRAGRWFEDPVAFNRSGSAAGPGDRQRHLDRLDEQRGPKRIAWRYFCLGAASVFLTMGMFGHYRHDRILRGVVAPEGALERIESAYSNDPERTSTQRLLEARENAATWRTAWSHEGSDLNRPLYESPVSFVVGALWIVLGVFVKDP